MADTLLRQIALVSESDHISASDVAKVSAALQKQATRDLVQFWDLKATVDAFPKLEDVPIGYWPIIVMDDIHTSGAAGVHEDKNGQPFALVTASDQLDSWSLTASHELIEMLVDPFGSRLIAGDSPKSDQGRVEILVEACIRASLRSSPTPSTACWSRTSTRCATSTRSRRRVSVTPSPARSRSRARCSAAAT